MFHIKGSMACYPKTLSKRNIIYIKLEKDVRNNDCLVCGGSHDIKDIRSLCMTSFTCVQLYVCEKKKNCYDWKYHDNEEYSFT